MSDESDRVLDAMSKQNRREWEAFLGTPLDELFEVMTTEELRAVLGILQGVQDRKRRDAGLN